MRGLDLVFYDDRFGIVRRRDVSRQTAGTVGRKRSPRRGAVAGESRWSAAAPDGERRRAAVAGAGRRSAGLTPC